MLWDALRAQAQSNLAAKGLVLDPARKNIAVCGITGAGKSSLIKSELVGLGGMCEWLWWCWHPRQLLTDCGGLWWRTVVRVRVGCGVWWRV